MRSTPGTLERYRIRKGPLASTDADGMQGAFHIPFSGGLSGTVHLRAIAHDGRDWEQHGFPPPAWEHVSVSLTTRCPTWDELEHVRLLFWGPEETVLQLHVPRTLHVNRHPHCLHLWKPIGFEIPLPPRRCVG